MSDLQKVQALFNIKILYAVLFIIILGFISIFVLNRIQPLKILETSMTENQTITTLRGELITVTFSRGASQTEKNRISIVANPQIEGELIWKKNNELFFTNEKKGRPLKEAQTYNLQIKYDKEILKELSFSTAEYRQLPKQQQFESFKEGQQQLIDLQTKKVEERPWIAKLPINNEAYKIIWDDANQQILVSLYLERGSLTNETLINSAKASAIENLRQVGVPLDSVRITYRNLNL